MKYADISKRFLAMLLDGLICGVLGWIMVILLSYYSFGLTIIASWLYFALMESSEKQATLGKMAVGVVVTDLYGNRISFGKATGRYFGKYVSSIFLIGYILALTNDRKQALHDSMAGTLVLDGHVASQQGYAPQPAAPVYNNAASNNAYSRPNNNVSPVLYGLTGEFSGRSIPIDDRGITIGRDASLCQVTFSQNVPGISRRHCTLSFNRVSSTFVLVDIGSSYGTFLESGMRVIQGQAVNLRAGDRFYLAERNNMFEVRI